MVLKISGDAASRGGLARQRDEEARRWLRARSAPTRAPDDRDVTGGSSRYASGRCAWPRPHERQEPPRCGAEDAHATANA